MFPNKAEIIADAEQYWNPGKTRFWREWGIDLVIGKREDYHIYDVSGRKLIDCHINGGTFNFGHRNPELVAALKDALDTYDVGNHHFPSVTRARLAKSFAKTTPGDLSYSVFGSGGGEAIDIALKTARHATGRRKIVSAEKGYHGHTGLAVAAGDDRFSSLFLSDGPSDQFEQVPFNDLNAMEQVLAAGDVAAVILETIPATYGFKMPEPDYLPGVRRLCDRYGTLYIADEVQTGLLRTGSVWAIETEKVEPDILVCGKGLSGGLYPIAAAVLSPKCAGWLEEDGFGHVSTFGGSELGCVVADRVLDMCRRPAVQANVIYISEYLRAGFDMLRETYGDVFRGVRQSGLIFGLEFNHPQGAMHMMRELYQNGVWAIFAAYDQSVLQFKPGVFWDKDLSDDFLDRFATSLAKTAPVLRTDKEFGQL